jgi:predicted cobalt transporter CbtA
MKHIISALAIIALLTGCATTEQQEKNCENQILAYETYRAILAAGDRQPSEAEITGAAVAAVYLRLNCGWEPLVTRSSRALVDDQLVPYIAPGGHARVE